MRLIFNFSNLIFIKVFSILHKQVLLQNNLLQTFGKSSSLIRINNRDSYQKALMH